MNPEYEALRSMDVRVRLLEKRSALLTEFLRQNGLAEPKSVEFSPLMDCREYFCFVNVEKQLQRAGGRMEVGWVFWEYQNVCIHTEAHAVWVNLQGRRRDITPRSKPPDRRILFLPDPRVAAKRGYTAGHRMILSSDPAVMAIENYQSELAKLWDEFFSGMGKEMVVPTDRLKEAADKCGLPHDVARSLVREKMSKY